MSTSLNAILGVAFLGLGVTATFLMFWLWGYDYDEEARKSSAPQWKMNIHRFVGFAYVAIYVVLMIQMVPRLWTYQVEFPARTVAHISVAIIIGVLLLVKISIIRFFRHLEELMPALGIALLICTFLITGLSLPFVFKERALVAAAPGGDAFSPASLERVARVLPTAGLPEDADLEALSSEASLRAGRDVLLGKCVLCHDLRTVIARPRTPADWYRTVARMLDKPSLGAPLTVADGQQVTAFLVSITPDLQKSAKAKRERALEQAEAKQAAAAVMVSDKAGAADDSAATDDAGDAAQSGDEAPGEGAALASIDADEAKELYEEECSLCHELSDVDASPPRTPEEVDDVVNRMIDNGLDLEPDDLAKIKWHLVKTFVE